MRRFRDRLDHLEAAPMLQRRYARPYRRDLRRIDIGKDDTRLGAAFGEYLTPRIDHDRMAERVAAVLVASALSGGEDETAVLDCTRAGQDVPMRGAGLLGEGRRDRDERRPGFRQGPIERRKPQVIADGEAEPTPGQINRHRQFAGSIAARLAVALAARKIHIEHVNLVVARDDLTGWINHERAVDGLLLQDGERERTDMNPDPEFTRQFAKGGECRILFFRHNGGEQALAFALHDVGHFRREYVIGA